MHTQKNIVCLLFSVYETYAETLVKNKRRRLGCWLSKGGGGGVCRVAQHSIELGGMRAIPDKGSATPYSRRVWIRCQERGWVVG